jgi:hypothetical protein
MSRRVVSFEEVIGDDSVGVSLADLVERVSDELYSVLTGASHQVVCQADGYRK